MKITVKILIILLCLFSILSCRKDEYRYNEPIDQLPLAKESLVATLIERTTLKDGSEDNILDHASCLTVKLPVTVTANGNNVVVNTTDDYNTVQAIFDASESDEDTLIITYPITLIFEDFTETIVNSDGELNNFRNLCESDNDEDTDIECIDFDYPISFTTYNTLNEKLSTEIITSDKELYDFINTIEDYSIVNINFPVTILDFSGSLITINTIEELQNTIENAINACDEHDGENNISEDEKEFSTLIIQCSWNIDEFEKNDQHLESQFDGYKFTFNEDGSAIATNASGTIYSGIWTINLTSSDLKFTIQFDDFSIISHTWELKEINHEDDGDIIDLSYEEDELKFKQVCN